MLLLLEHFVDIFYTGKGKFGTFLSLEIMYIKKWMNKGGCPYTNSLGFETRYFCGHFHPDMTEWGIKCSARLFEWGKPPLFLPFNQTQKLIDENWVIFSSLWKIRLLKSAPQQPISEKQVYHLLHLQLFWICSVTFQAR